jgi:hypothetical protein
LFAKPCTKFHLRAAPELASEKNGWTMVGAAGIEPATLGLEMSRPVQLYRYLRYILIPRFRLVLAGLEGRFFQMVGMVGSYMVRLANGGRKDSRAPRLNSSPRPFTSSLDRHIMHGGKHTWTATQDGYSSNSSECRTPIVDNRHGRTRSRLAGVSCGRRGH